jgi:hypothetical protein
LPRKSRTTADLDFQQEQLRLLRLIHEELLKLNSNIAMSSRFHTIESLPELSDDSDELDAFE